MYTPLTYKCTMSNLVYYSLNVREWHYFKWIILLLINWFKLSWSSLSWLYLSGNSIAVGAVPDVLLGWTYRTLVSSYWFMCFSNLLASPFYFTLKSTVDNNTWTILCNCWRTTDERNIFKRPPFFCLSIERKLGLYIGLLFEQLCSTEEEMQDVRLIFSSGVIQFTLQFQYLYTNIESTI